MVIATTLVLGLATGSSPNIIILGLIPWAICVAMISNTAINLGMWYFRCADTEFDCYKLGKNVANNP
jgi:hypothetical protein